MLAVLDLVLGIAWVTVVAGVRTAVLYQASGRVPVAAVVRRGEPQWWARVLGTVGFVLAVATPIGALAGLPAFAPLDRPPVA